MLGISLSSWRPVSFSERTLLHGFGWLVMVVAVCTIRFDGKNCTLSPRVYLYDGYGS
jgi:hypothetical protein